jgi:hypothetical protein
LRVTDGAVILGYSGDTGELERGVPSPGLLEAIADADLAVLNAFAIEGIPHLHMSGSAAGRAAQLARVRNVLLTHVYARVEYPERQIAEALKEFSGRVQLAMQGKSYLVSEPFSNEPVLTLPEAFRGFLIGRTNQTFLSRRDDNYLHLIRGQTTFGKTLSGMVDIDR